ncbi:MAG: hypothetical protein ACOCTG_00115 [Bacteroidota bacterium]
MLERLKYRLARNALQHHRQHIACFLLLLMGLWPVAAMAHLTGCVRADSNGLSRGFDGTGDIALIAPVIWEAAAAEAGSPTDHVRSGSFTPSAKAARVSRMVQAAEFLVPTVRLHLQHKVLRI